MKLAITSIAFAAILSAFSSDIPQPAWTNHARLAGSTQVMTNFKAWAENIQFEIEHGGQTPWDLELTKTETIPASAYRGASNLRSVYSFGDATITIGAMAFAYLPNLRSVSLSKAGSIASDSFYGCYLDEYSILTNTSSTTVNFSTVGGATVRRLNVPYAHSFASESFRYKNFPVEIGDLPELTSFGGDNVFQRNTGLISVGNMPNLTTSGNRIFHGCTALERVGDLSSMETIPDGFFMECSSLKSVGDMGNVKTLYRSAFYATALEAVPYTITNVVTMYGNCFARTEIKEIKGNFRNLTTVIGEGPFQQLTHVTNITGLVSLTNLTSHGFMYCEQLEYIGELSSLRLITGDSHFARCNNLKMINMGSQTSSDVETIDGFGFLPSSPVVIRCADGDFYKSGSSLVPAN